MIKKAALKYLVNKSRELEKKAFWGVTPFSVKSVEEYEADRVKEKGLNEANNEGPYKADREKPRHPYESGGVYAKEYGNKFLGSLLGTAPGAAILAAGASIKNKPITIAGGLAALAGGTVGGYKSLKKTERELGVKETNVPQYLGRATAAGVGDALVPLIGGISGDYITSRNIIKNHKDNQ